MLSGDSPFIENLSKSERQAKRAKRKDTRKKKVAQVKKKVGAAKQKAVEKAKKVGSIAALLPLRVPMQVVLKAKGIQPKSDLSDLARQFYAEVVKKDSYETELDFENGNNVAVDYSNMPSFMQESIEPVTITAIVSGILSFFKGVKEKKAAGEPLTKVQQVAYKAGTEAEAQGTQMAIDEVEEGIGETVTGFAALIKNNIAIIAGLAAIALGLYFYKKK